MSNSSPVSNPRSLPVHVQKQPSTSTPNTEEQFLQLHLVPNTKVLLPIQQLAQVITIPLNQIVPIPHMPEWVMGVYNWRGEILWMVDLGHLCGLTPWYQHTVNISTHVAVVLRIHEDARMLNQPKNQVLGLVVERVENTEWCDPETFQSPPPTIVTPELTPFLRGYWWRSNDDMLTVLDGKAIIEAMPKS